VTVADFGLFYVLWFSCWQRLQLFGFSRPIKLVQTKIIYIMHNVQDYSVHYIRHFLISTLIVSPAW